MTLVVSPPKRKNRTKKWKSDINETKTGWWFQILFIFTPIVGEDEPILTHIFQMG